MAKKKTLGEKIQQHLDKLEKLHENEETGYGGTDPY